MGLSLKKFIKYFDDMNELLIYDWNKSSEPLFRGYTFDKGAKRKLRKLYKKYELERNDDGMAVLVFPYVNEHGAKLAKVQINVKGDENTMRDPNRLDGFYSELKYLHKKYLPDLRFCQVFLNFLGWLNTNKGIADAFYMEDDKMIDFFIQYIDEVVENSTKYSG